MLTAVLPRTIRFTAFHLARALLFILGAIIGSYLNVVSLRFSEKKGFGASVKGRSRCPHCRKELQWHELIPVLSFVFQRGRCRRCGQRLSLQYPLVEILAGLTLVFIPLYLGWSLLAALWILIFLILLLISAIDFRLRIIPDKLTLFIALVGAGVALLNYSSGSLYAGSFLGSYSWIFMWSDNFWLNRGAGIVFGFLFFGAIHFLTKGKAMGLGDVKFAAALGLLLGWPDIALALVSSFVFGALYAAPLLLAGRKGLKSAVPFGPFMALGVTLVFFFGYHILNGYFRFFNGFYVN